ncbi:MAG: sodium/proton-translocating pyrophosphatase, partial [Candidatus Caldarchaeum sp.]|nr:sodium/proton-translocating pyrophosphatase [Candidatus Caldarchaeum sp.]
MMVDLLTVSMVLGVLGALTAVGFVALVNRYPKGGPAFVSVWSAIREGSIAYLKRQYRTIFTIAFFIFLLIVGSFAAFPQMGGLVYGLQIGGSFLLGVAFSIIAASIAMDSATRANVRTTYAASVSSVSALRVATMGGAALGLAVIAM